MFSQVNREENFFNFLTSPFWKLLPKVNHIGLPIIGFTKTQKVPSSNCWRGKERFAYRFFQMRTCQGILHFDLDLEINALRTFPIVFFFLELEIN